MQRLLVTAVMAVAACRVCEALPVQEAATPRMKPWSWPPLQPDSVPRVTAPVRPFWSRILPAGDARPRPFTPAGGDVRPRPLAPADEARLRSFTPAGGNLRPRPLVPAGVNTRSRPLIPAGGDARPRPLNPAGGNAGPRPLTPAGNDVRPRPFTPTGDNTRSRPLTPAGDDPSLSLLTPAAGDARRRPLTPAEVDFKLRPLAPAVDNARLTPTIPVGGDAGLNALIPGGDDTNPEPVLPGGGDTSLLGPGAPSTDGNHQKPAAGDITKHGSTSPAGGTAEIGSRFGFPAKDELVPLFGGRPIGPSPPVFPAPPPNSAEVTVVLPGPAAFPSPPAFPSVDYDADTLQVPLGPPLGPPPRQERVGFLGGILSHFANKIFGRPSGGRGGLLGFLPSLFPAVDDIREGAEEGLRLADGELTFQKQQKVESLGDIVRDTVRTVGEVGQSQYRKVLQVKDAVKDFVSETAGNTGEYADKATVANYNMMEDSLKAVGRMIKDKILAFLNGMIAKGQAATDLVKDQGATDDKTTSAVFDAKREAMRDTVQAVTNLLSGGRRRDSIEGVY